MQGFVYFRIPLSVRRVVTMVPSFIVIAMGLNVTEVLVFSRVILSFGIALAVIPLVWFCSRPAVMGDLVIARGTQLFGWAVVSVIALLNLFLLLGVGG